MRTETLTRLVPRALHAARSSQELFTALRQSIEDAGYGGSHAVVLRDPSSDALRICTSNDARHPPGARLRSVDRGVDDALRAGQIWYAKDAPARFEASPEELPISSAIPLRTGDDECYGALVTTERVLDEQREALELIGEHLGLALFRVQLQEETSRRHQNDLTKLSLMTRAGEVLRSIELEPILAKLMELALSAVGAEVGCIVLCEEGRATVRVEWGIDPELLEHLRLSDGRAVSDAVIDDVRPIVSGDVPSDSGVCADGPAEAVGSFVAVPLATRDRTLGCLIVARGEGGGFDESDLELLSVTTGLSSNAIENAILHKTEIERERLQAELRLAGEVQKGLLPSEVPDLRGLACDARVWPCDDSGGDYYDFMQLDEHRLAFCVGDATGHGIGAAFITTTARACLRACMHEQEIDLGALFGRVSALLEDDLPDGKFITIFLGIYDARDRTISYVSAGHDAGLLYRSGTGRFDRLDATGAPLGIFPGLTFEATQTEPLHPGDVLVVKSDGVTEAENPDGEQFGEDRLHDAIRTHHAAAPDALVTSIHEEVLAYRDGAPQTDDVTILCVCGRDTT